MRGERTKGIDAACRFNEMDGGEVVVDDELAYLIRGFLFDVLFDCAVTVFRLLCLSVYEIVIDLENFRKSLGYKCTLCVVLHNVRIDENAFRRVIGGEHDTVSVGDLSPFCGDGGFINHLLEHESSVIPVLYDLQIKESSDDNCGKKCTHGKKYEGPNTHGAGRSADDRAWFGGIGFFVCVHVSDSFRPYGNFFRKL